MTVATVADVATVALRIGARGTMTVLEVFNVSPVAARVRRKMAANFGSWREGARGTAAMSSAKAHSDLGALNADARVRRTG